MRMWWYLEERVWPVLLVELSGTYGRLWNLETWNSDMELECIESSYNNGRFMTSLVGERRWLAVRR